MVLLCYGMDINCSWAGDPALSHQNGIRRKRRMGPRHIFRYCRLSDLFSWLSDRCQLQLHHRCFNVAHKRRVLHSAPSSQLDDNNFHLFPRILVTNHTPVKFHPNFRIISCHFSSMRLKLPCPFLLGDCDHRQRSLVLLVNIGTHAWGNWLIR